MLDLTISGQALTDTAQCSAQTAAGTHLQGVKG